MISTEGSANKEQYVEGVNSNVPSAVNTVTQNVFEASPNRLNRRCDNTTKVTNTSAEQNVTKVTNIQSEESERGVQGCGLKDNISNQTPKTKDNLTSHEDNLVCEDNMTSSEDNLTHQDYTTKPTSDSCERVPPDAADRAHGQNNKLGRVESTKQKADHISSWKGTCNYFLGSCTTHRRKLSTASSKQEIWDKGKRKFRIVKTTYCEGPKTISPSKNILKSSQGEINQINSEGKSERLYPVFGMVKKRKPILSQDDQKAKFPRVEPR